MELFGATHLAVLGAILFLSLGAALLRVVGAGAGTVRAVAIALACVLLASKVAAFLMGWPKADLQNALPMHLCDWTCFAAMIALVWRRQLAFEMTWFWGLGGSLQALLTPDLAYDFPDPRFLAFFISHGGILVAIALLAFGMRMRPVPASLLRILLWTNLYVVIAGGLDYLLGANYGYLCQKPVHASLLDHLGPWPYYILSLEGINLASCLIWYAPFFAYDLLRRKGRD